MDATSPSTSDNQAQLALQILNLISQACYQLDKTRTIVFVNGYAEQLFGKGKEDILGKSAGEVFTESIGSSFYKALEEVLKNKKKSKEECYCTTLHRWLTWEAYPMDEGCILVFQEITDRAEGQRKDVALRETEKEYSAKLEEEIQQQTKELIESKDVLQATLDSSLDMIQVFKAIRNDFGEIVDFIWILNNHTSEKMYGDVIGKSLLNNNPGVREEGIFDSFKQVIATGIPQRYEKHYVHEQFDGWFLQSVVKLEDGVVTTTTDVTSLKKAQLELLQSKELLQDVIDAPNIGIAVYKTVRNKEGKIIDFVHEYINRASLSMLGEDFTGKLFSDHGENAILQMPQFTEVIETGKPNSYIREADFRGRTVWFAITNTPLDGDRLVHTWEEITARKNAEAEILRLRDEVAQKAEDGLRESENRFQSIANLVTDLLWDSEPDGSTNWYNQRWLEYTGQSFEQAIGWGWVDAIHPDDREGSAKRYGEAVEAGKPLRQEHRIRRHDGEYRWFVVNASPLKDKEGHLVKMYGAATDIHDSKQAENALLVSSERIRFLKEAYQSVVNGAALSDSLFILARLAIQELSGEARVAFYLANAEGTQLHTIRGAGNMPDEYANEIDGFLIGANSLACGLAVSMGRSVITEDVYKEPLWAPWTYIAEKYDYRGCWAFPIKTRAELAVGTFGLYFKEVRQVRAQDLALADVITQAASVIIASYSENRERVRAEESLMQSEQKLRIREQELSRVQEVGMVAGIDISFNGDVSQSSGWRSLEYRNLHGLLPGITHETHDDWSRRLHPDDREMANNVLKEALASGSSTYKSEYRIIRPIDGQVRWIFARVDIERNEVGKPTRLVGAHIDVTERKEIEQRLQEFNVRLEQQVRERTQDLLESRDLHQSVFNTSLIQMSVLKAIRNEYGKVEDFQIMIVNKELEKETGRTDLVGKHYAAEYPGIKQIGLFDLMLEVLETGEPAQMEYFYPHEGFNKWFSCMFVKLEDGLVATNLDVTERKKAELASAENTHFVQRLAIASPDTLFVMNIRTKEIVYANQTLAQLMGYSEMERAKMKNEILDVIEPQDQERAYKHIEEMATASDGEIRSIEYRAIDAKGRTHWMSDRNTVFRRDLEGKVLEKIGVTHEITYLKKAEEELLKLQLSRQKEILNAVLLAQEKERQNIGEALHNGVGQLLYSVRIKCEMLELTSESNKGFLREIDKALEESIQAIRNLSSELMPIVLIDFGIEEALRSLFPKIARPGLSIRLQVTGLDVRLPEHLELAIYRMVQELLNNIVKHAFATRAEISIAQTEHTIKIVVKDNGRGFDEKATGGLHKGLGLQSVQNRAKLLDAKMHISGGSGNGTYVELDIPFKRR